MRETISRHHDSVLGPHHPLVERIEKIIPEASPFSIADQDMTSRSDWGLNSDATVGEVLEAMHNRIFGFTRDLDDILATEASVRLTRGQEESFPVPPEIPFELEKEEEEEMNNEEHFVLPADPPGLMDEITKINNTEEEEKKVMRFSEVYPDVMTPPPGLDGMKKTPAEDSPIEWIDESERERRRLEIARRRSSSSTHAVLNTNEAMDIGQRNNFDSPKAVVMDFSTNEVSPDAQISHERAIRRRLRNRQKLKASDSKSSLKVKNEENSQMSEIDRTKAAIDRLENELESSRSKAKELEAKLSNKMSRLGMSMGGLRQQRESERKISSPPSSKVLKTKPRKPLPPLSLEQTWMSTPASRLPQASVVFNNVMNAVSKHEERERAEEDTISKGKSEYKPLSDKELSMIQTFRGRYGKRRVVAGVEPIADEETIMSSKHFHMKLMGMSPLSRHPEPYSGVESPHARLWDLKPIEYNQPEALHSNIKIAEIESLKQRTPSRKRAGRR